MTEILTRWKSNSCSCRAFASCTSEGEKALFEEKTDETTQKISEKY